MWKHVAGIRLREAEPQECFAVMELTRFQASLFGEEELSVKECEGRWVKLEEMDWRRESKAPWAVWLTDVGEKPGQRQRKAVMAEPRAF